MSATNWLLTRKRAYDTYTVTKTAAYTVRTGTTANGHVIDPVVVYSDPAANCTVTVANGTYVGQIAVITLESNASSKTVTITCTTGTDYTMATAGMYVVLMWVGATTGWVALASSTTS